MKFILISIMVMLGFLTRAHADAQIIVTSTDVIGTRLRIGYTITSWSTSDNKISNCDGSDNRLRECTISPEVLYAGGVQAVRSVSSSYIFLARFGDITVGELLVGLGGRIKIPHRGYAFFADQDMIAGNLQNLCLAMTSWSQPRWPRAFSNCVDLMPTAVSCDITGSNTIDHKTLLDDALDGAQASTQLSLKCNRSANVTVRATRTNSYGVSLKGDSLYSEVKINGMNATDGIGISATDNWSTPINITSTLKTRGTVTPGPFSGSTVITVSPN